MVDAQRQKYFSSWENLNEHGRIIIDTEKAIDQEVYLANQDYAHKELLIHRVNILILALGKVEPLFLFRDRPNAMEEDTIASRSIADYWAK